MSLQCACTGARGSGTDTGRDALPAARAHAGQVLLAQGSEASDAHFLLSGTVQLQYTAPPLPADECAGPSQPLTQPPLALGIR